MVRTGLSKDVHGRPFLLMGDSGWRTLVRSLPVFAAYVGWRGRVPGADHSLINALASSNDDVRDLAGVLVGRSGDKARDLLRKALEDPSARPRALLLLGDLGDPELASSIEPFTDHPDPKTARAANDALRILAAANETATSGH